MSSMLRRPPAYPIHWPHDQKGPTTQLQNYGAVDQKQNVGPTSTTQRGLMVWILDLLQINPALEQPRLEISSARQPFIRTHHNARFVRTFMTASPRFQGRWIYVGYIQRQYAERTRITGVPTRLGQTYSYRPAKLVPPRVVELGG